MIRFNFIRKFSLLGIAFIASNTTTAQSTSKNGQNFDLQLNTITTAVPFLLISPDSRASAMGDLGVATSPDINSQHWNASKYAFAEEEGGISFSYSPWLRSLGINDINLVYLAGYKKIDKRSAISGSMRYFSLGSITFTDNTGGVIKQSNPKEFAFDAAYSVLLGKNISGSMTARFVNSNLTEGLTVGAVETKPGRSIAIDLGMFYTSNKFKLGDYKSTLNVGGQIETSGSGLNRFSDTDFTSNIRVTVNL